MELSIEPSLTPRPTCAAFAPPEPGVDAAPARCSLLSASWNVAREPLKPMVLTLARLLAVTSSIVWCVLRPEMAEYIARIICASLLRGGGGLLREVQPLVGVSVFGDLDHAMTALSMLVKTCWRMDASSTAVM